MESYQQFIGELRDSLRKYRGDFSMRREGTVVSAGDGIVRIDGLPECKYGELLEFENDVYGIALNMEKDCVGAALLDNTAQVREGSAVLGSERVVEVPVGDELLGRIINPLGRPLDKRGRVTSERSRPIECEAPRIIDRDKVTQPLQTGILAIDSMIPIGRGQRELLIGDRQTGKTAIAIDTILNQRDKNVVCVYVAIGQKASTITRIAGILEEHGAMEYCVLVASTASDSAPMQYVAPYAGCAIAEDFMLRGRDALIVYDDLSKHAVAYRTLSLLLRRPPGREAYPGDVFYLHSRLLERAAKLSADLGGGSMTALPIVETMAGDISAYIPTNVISITDGQIYLESELFYAGVRPAVNVGLSVSRVGGSAQTRAMRAVSGRLRLDLAQYREMAVFAQFASELDKSTRLMLRRGERLTQMLKQPQYSPLPVSDQTVLLHAVTSPLLDPVPAGRIAEFRAEFLEYMHVRFADLLRTIDAEDQLTDEMKESLDGAIREFLKDFLTEEGAEEET
ncbi:MAG: F0F1 ATP synthase subunit alpha [Clostridiales bacterium]|nr:F0F1 ATP synthase subunit alpha [Clostridiales bacterium]